MGRVVPSDDVRTIPLVQATGPTGSAEEERKRLRHEKVGDRYCVSRD